MYTYNFSDKKNKCFICRKPCQENTGGNYKYCQGHTINEVINFKKSEIKRINSKN